MSVSQGSEGGFSEKEREQDDLELRSSNANKALQAAQTSLSSLKAQVRAKQDDIKSAFESRLVSIIKATKR